jgi:hypothetical protein
VRTSIDQPGLRTACRFDRSHRRTCTWITTTATAGTPHITMMRPLILASMLAAGTAISLHPLEKGGPGPDVSRLERLEGGEKISCVFDVCTTLCD